MTPAQTEKPRMTDFKPYLGKKHKPGTGYIGKKGPNLWEGRYSPMWIDGKKHARNVYAHIREECEEKLKVLIEEMKAELTELKEKKATCEAQVQISEGKRDKKSKENK